MTEYTGAAARDLVIMVLALAVIAAIFGVLELAFR
jgi:hypothetical protein